jgi:hypothetical protein
MAGRLASNQEWAGSIPACRTSRYDARVKRLLLIPATLLAVAAMAPAATASHVVRDTGWFCPVLGQTANAGGGYSYVCWSYRWFLVHREG